MKNIYVLLLVITVLLSAEKLYSQYASSATQFPFIKGPAADGSPMIKYYIPRSGNVKLTVYVITGREVAVLVNENKSDTFTDV